MLTSGSRLGPYEILSSLGAGGMGEVYKARDTRLDRLVAIKVLGGVLAADQQFHERFEREAQSIAALSLADGQATTWNPNPVVAPNAINNIYAMLLSGQTLYIGGSHRNIGGATRTNAAALDTVTATVLPWNPNPNLAVRALAQGHGVIYVGGEFTRIAGQQITNLAALSPTVAESRSARCCW